VRISAILAGLFFVGAITFFNIEPANAISIEETNTPKLNFGELKISDAKSDISLIAYQPEKTPAQKPVTKPVEKKVKVIKHKVKPGETLTKIAASYKVDWQRIYDKNKLIENPDLINVGDVLTIPEAKEKLERREIPVASAVAEPQQVPAEPATGNTSVAATPAAPQPVPVGSSAGNTYYYGYCTFYAKSRRPDLPNNLGNADTWVARAAAQGLPTGSAPRAGAIGQQGMHVVYVESVNSNGTVTISEMNFNGWGVVSSRTVPASTFMYIY
jgi:surface antigen